MTGDMVKNVAAGIGRLVEERAVELQRAMGFRAVKPLWPQQCPANLYLDAHPSRANPILVLKHLLFMAGEVQKQIDGGKVEKAMRWLGFMQGVVWMLGASSLADLKRANMVDEEKPALTMKEAVRLATAELTRVIGQEPRQMRIEEVNEAKIEFMPKRLAWHVTLSCLENDENRKYRLFTVSDAGVVVNDVAELEKELSGG